MKDKPFFLYFSTHDIHVPRVRHARFSGKSGLGPRGEVILQLDWCAGEILGALDRLKLAESTMVIFTSDNGPVVDEEYKDQAVEKLGDHKPAGPLRGGKYSIFERCTRVPFIVRWPGRVQPGVTEALVCQVDFVASFAALADEPLATADAPDSFNVLPALLGDSKAGRDHLVEHAGTVSLRQGQQKFIPAGKGPKRNAATSTELGNDPEGQLYDLSDDLGETRNTISQDPAKAAAFEARLEKIRADGRTRH